VMERGVHLYLEHVNSKGGVNGRKFEIVTADTQYSIKNTLLVFKRLVGKDKVFMVFGPGNTGAAIALAPLLEKHKVPQMSLMPGKILIFPPRKCYFTPAGTWEWGIHCLFDYAIHDRNLKGAKFGIIYINNEFGKVHLRAAKERAEFYNVELVPVVLNPGETNAVSQVLNLKKSGVKAVVLGLFQEGASTVLKDAYSYGYNPLFLGGFVTTVETTFVVAGPEVSKAVQFAGFSPYASPYMDRPGCPELRDLAKEMTDLPSGMGFVCGVTQAKIVTEGFKRAGRNLTFDSFINGMESLKDCDLGGIHPPVTYGPNRRYGTKSTPLYELDKEDRSRLKLIDTRSPREKPFD